MVSVNRSIAAAVLLFVIAAFYVGTLRAGHQWGDDFALYLHHARNLIEGKPYTDVGLIDNPLRIPDLGPPFYPPGFPLLAAPVLKMYGLNFTALKIEVVLSFVAGLLACYGLFRDRLPGVWSIALIALIGFNPAYWRFSNDIASDFPFLAVAFGSLWLIQTSYRRFKDHPPLWMAVPFGVCLYFAFAMRPHGIAVLGAFGAYELFRTRRIRPILLVTMAVAIGGIAAQTALLGRDTRFRLLNLSLKWLIYSPFANLKSYRTWWLTGYLPAPSFLLFGAVLLITIYGFWRSIRSGVHIYDWFAIFYTLVIIPYYLVFERYLIPVVPVLMLYLMIGFYQVSRRLPPNAARVALAGGLTAVVFAYGTVYQRADRSPIREGPFDPDFVALCQYLDAHTAPGSRLIFRKPRLLTLLTDRPAGIYHEPEDRAGLWDFIRANGIRYLVVANVPSQEFDSDRTYLRPFVAAYRDHFTTIYQNDRYELLLITL